MSNGAGKFNDCICISTLGATVMIWEKFYVEIQGEGLGDLRCPFLGAPMGRINRSKQLGPHLQSGTVFSDGIVFYGDHD